MCTRFYVEPETEELQETIEEMNRSPLVPRFLKAGSGVQTSGEVRPTHVVPVLAPNRDGEKAVYPMRWGFQIRDYSLIVNARSETAAEKRSFREAWEKHRCIIPASWYYEWEHIETPAGRTKLGDRYAIQPRGRHIAWLCGLYRIEEGFPVFVVLTREPSEELRWIHDRMPVILPGDLVEEWIRPDTKPEEMLKLALTDMIMEKK